MEKIAVKNNRSEKVKRDRQTDRQTGRQTDRQTDKSGRDIYLWKGESVYNCVCSSVQMYLSRYSWFWFP